MERDEALAGVADVLDDAGVGVLLCTAGGVLLGHNGLAHQWLGVEPGIELPGRSEPWAVSLVALLQQVAASGGRPIRGVLPGADGRQLQLVSRAVPSRDPVTVLCLLRQPVEARPDSPETAELLQAMIEGSHDGLAVLSATGQILHVNGTVARFHGLRKDQMIGRYVEDLVTEGYFDRAITAEVISQGLGVTGVQVLRDGRRLLISGRPIVSADGQLRYVVATVRDVTEFNRLMGHLHEATQRSEGYRAELRKVAMREAQAARMVARSAAMRLIREKALQYATVNSPVLLLGETGTGKGLLARLIHEASTRSAGPFLTVNCGAIPEGLLEPELFGYVRGAFTGADPRGKLGLLELAHAGTLLLDEVGDLPLGLQVKLLRFWETGEILPVGGVKPKRPDVRIIAATNCDLSVMLEQGRFRRDLFFRLNVLAIRIPALRDRREDIPPLIAMMLNELHRRSQKRLRMSPSAMAVLSAYEFPGNVRELWNLLERVSVTAGNELIDVGDLPTEVTQGLQAGRTIGPSGDRGLRQAMREAEAAALKKAIEEHGTQARAARYLGLSQATLSRKLRRYRLR